MTKKLIKLIVLVAIETALVVFATVKVYAEPSKANLVTRLYGDSSSRILVIEDEFMTESYATSKLIKSKGSSIKLSLTTTDKMYKSDWDSVKNACLSVLPKTTKEFTAVTTYTVNDTKYVSVLSFRKPRQAYMETWVVKNGTFDFESPDTEVTISDVEKAFIDPYWSQRKGFYWTNAYATSREQAIEVLNNFRGSNSNYKDYKEMYTLNVGSDKDDWYGYNDVVRVCHTTNATMVHCIAKNTWVVFSYENGRCHYRWTLCTE